MNYVKVSLAWIQAKRFICQCEDVMGKNNANRCATFSGCKETGQLRRTSMDLTRSLAELRKSD